MNKVILEGIVGSTAYGLAREGSDVDTLGVFVAPTIEIAGMHWNTHRESVVRKDPDSTHHEVGKFLRLLVKGNPTINELLWLEDEGYTQTSIFGETLRYRREDFLSTATVKRAYLGYASDQLKRAASREDSFSADTKGRTTKHARHCLRLLRHAQQLFRTGQLTLHIDDPQEYWAFDEMPFSDIRAFLEDEVTRTEETAQDSVLRPEPKTGIAEEILAMIRIHELHGRPL